MGSACGETFRSRLRWIVGLAAGISAIASPSATAAETGVLQQGLRLPQLAEAPAPLMAQADSAESLQLQGYQQLGQGNYEAAIALFEQALAQFRARSNPAEVAVTLNLMGQAYGSLGQPDAAIAVYQEALDLARRLGNTQIEADSLNNLGTIAYNIDNYDEALTYFEQALDLNRTLDDQSQTATILVNLGAVAQSLGDYAQSIAYLEQSVTLFRALGDRASEAYAMTQLGLSYVRSGRYPEALVELQAAISIQQAVGNRSLEAAALNVLSLTYFRLGQLERAGGGWQQALEILQSVNSPVTSAYVLGNLGGVQESLEQYALAQQYYEQSLALHRQISNRDGEASVLNNLGSLFYNQAQDDQALPYYTDALALFREIGSTFGEARSLNNIALIDARQGRLEAAIARYNQAIEIYQTLDDPQGEARTRRNLALISAQQNRFDDAETELRRSLALLDEVRAETLSDADKITLFETQQDIYRTLEGVLLLSDRPEEALVAAETGRTRAFAELIALNLSEQLAQRIAAQPPDLAEIQRIAQRQNATLVEYSLAETDLGEAALNIWVVQPSGAVEFRSVPFQSLANNLQSRTPDALLDTLIESVRLTTGGRGLGVVAAADSSANSTVYRQLHQILIDPIAELLPRDPSARVILIPQGNLFLVPFAALEDENGSPLIAKHTLSTAPSIQVLGLTQQLDRNRTSALSDLNPSDFLVVGNPTMPQIWSPETNSLSSLPPLPGAQQEAEAIASLFNLQALTGSQATETRVKQQAGTAEVIHLATHGLLEYGQVEASGTFDLPGAIALTPGPEDDGLLTAGEILQLELQADLVVLSACDTGLGRITGDGVVGLSRALVVAGTPSVVVSLWSVPDAPTAELMTAFYQQLSQGETKAEALRQAMLTVRDRYPNPRDWAAFTLMGEAQ
ncbi:MAG: CHAT domain-containing protein [Cyanobacteria bacterium P01_H01_bin.119]